MLKNIISIANQKGGVGKTTTSINLACALGLAGHKTLLIDLDPQANCTSGLGARNINIKKNIYNIFFDQQINFEGIIKTEYLNLFLIPSHIDLVGIDVELIDMPKREYILKKALSTLAGDFAYIILDCPPALNLLTINALTASNSIIIPVQAEYFALEGLTQLLNSITLIKDGLNSNLEVLGLLLTMYSKEKEISHRIKDELLSHFKDKVFRTIIAEDDVFKEAPSFGKPALFYNVRSVGAQGYVDLAEEVLVKSTQMQTNQAHR